MVEFGVSWENVKREGWFGASKMAYPGACNGEYHLPWELC